MYKYRLLNGSERTFVCVHVQEIIVLSNASYTVGDDHWSDCPNVGNKYTNFKLTGLTDSLQEVAPHLHGRRRRHKLSLVTTARSVPYPSLTSAASNVVCRC
eukprot:GHVU01043040.1.p2 GENE.GHVU01043040.1~~GHVU01043040.1.p2  ORF type:complete len:101 (+),score=4.42 GHVU01043040.1:858-1160(+)